MEHSKNFQPNDEYNWIMDVSEPNQLRNAIQEMKQHYINKLINANLLDPSARDACTLTLSQLKAIIDHNRLTEQKPVKLNNNVG
ncbi:Fur-regulated basic protein FbpA [Halobacillus sp. A5]|uniref:Fur-regulated basic protein FbpA n=1 Tax=Halobacillus sp. A5 TaxID=2880263 RepID=UPI0020A6AC57|nr:Fur-regulated basic protein FbpA [Halobacillus sp. A5]MCP3025763.1 Fur-regulated basic protein FbpA [Halobacillus sp. A5]